ncbi:MAG: DUF234 domain-containing protein [Jiangellaceae bacterium]
MPRVRRTGCATTPRPPLPVPAHPLLRANRTPRFSPKIADVYLGFWLSVLRDDAELIEGGQGSAVLHRQRARLDRHVSATFEQVARDHAVRLGSAGRLPAGTVVGRWWLDEVVEIDVVGLSGVRPVLVGEVRWENTPVGRRGLRELQGKITYLPDDAIDPRLALWTRSGVEPELQPSASDLWVFSPEDML